jgi:hypothetical protein
MTLMLSSCVTRQEINAVIFLHEQIPETICDHEPELKKLGVYRIMDCTQNLIDLGICKPGQQRVRERISYCKPGIKNYFGVKDSDLEAILKKAGIKD